MQNNALQIYDIKLSGDRHEETQHGSFDFPLAVYVTKISRNVLGFIDWHWHTELQFCVVTNGMVEFCVGSEKVKINAGDGIFINSNCLHMAQNAQGSDGAYICLDFDPRLISGFDGSAVGRRHIAPYVANSRAAYILLDSSNTEQCQILQHLLNAYQLFYSNEQDRDELGITIELMQTWQKLEKIFLQKIGGNTATQNDDKRLCDVVEYISEYCCGDIKLDDIANRAGLSSAGCCRMFKRRFGCTVFSYIQRLRLQRASQLLAESDTSITEIALHCGFSSSSYFSKEFKEATGITPSEYRKAQQLNFKPNADTD